MTTSVRNVRAVLTTGGTCAEVSEAATLGQATENTTTNVNRTRCGSASAGASAAAFYVRAPFGVLSLSVSTRCIACVVRVSSYFCAASATCVPTVGEVGVRLRATATVGEPAPAMRVGISTTQPSRRICTSTVFDSTTKRYSGTWGSRSGDEEDLQTIYI